MTRFDSLLIANRGEIAVRVARSARAMGLRTIAVFSDADRDAPHARACDHAVAIGGTLASNSYLRIDKLLEAARVCGARAVHPGYGFLSENGAFAQAVLDAGLAWIGPPPAAMHAMADKAQAKRRMASAGVPVLPGSDDAGSASPAELRDAARRLGAPLMIKAVAGGGGRGMRLVTDLAQFDAALDAAAAEALAAFGHAGLLVERALLAPRHVEVQVFADARGGVIHLGERDCSVQRRHQKLIEEAPSPAVSPPLRRRLGDVAVAVAREVGYVGAGTVEFLLDANGAFWFMEMNTRLQVEHAVTEALVGVDLVEWQLRIAAGELLPFGQDEALARFERGGCCVEARLCAEDPALGHLPQAGVLQRWQPAHGVRCDHALESGLAVSPFYDSMLAKLVAHAPTRDAAVARLADALDRTVCLGLPTNRAFLAGVLRDPVMAQGGATTAFLAHHEAAAMARAQGADAALHALAAATLATLAPAALPALWAGWTSSHRVACDVPLRIGERTETWRLDGTPGALVARCSEATHRIDALLRESRGSVHAIVDGCPRTARVASDGARSWWLCDGIEIVVDDLRLRSAARADAPAAGALQAPMHGRVTQVPAAAGARVDAGALLLVMEAMKMEHRIHAPFAGTVAAVHARVGDQVGARQLLVEVTR